MQKLLRRLLRPPCIRPSRAPPGSSTPRRHGRAGGRLPRHARSPIRTAGSKTTTRRRRDDWVEAENKVTVAYLAPIPEREAIKQAPDRALELRALQRRRLQRRRPLLLQQQRRPAEPDRPLHARRRSTATPTRAARSRTRCPKDGTVALAGARRQRRRQACSPTASPRPAPTGTTWNVRDVATGKDLPTTSEVGQVHGSRRGPTDGKGFFYSRYRRADEAARSSRRPNFNQKLYYHQLGTPQSRGRAGLRAARPARLGLRAAHVTEDGRYLRHHASARAPTPKNRVFYQGPRRRPARQPVELIDDFDDDVRLRRQRRRRSSTSGPTSTRRAAGVIAIDTAQPGREQLEGDHPRGEGHARTASAWSATSSSPTT